MYNSKTLFTAESVSEGHPDKVCDQISDAILDAYLKNDPDARVAVECLITHQHLTIAGEVKTSSQQTVDAIGIAKQVIEEIGYTGIEIGFDVKQADYHVLIHEQSTEINTSVKDGGAGDQGLMFGYACNETEDLMPLPVWLAHRIVERLAKLRKNRTLPWLLPDAKSQVTVIYENGKPAGIDNVLVSTQHLEDFEGRNVKEFLREEIVNHALWPVIEKFAGDSEPRFIINPSGSFTKGGPAADTGLTGRKIIVDTYGGSAPHGGGAFSGKDPSKVDRSAAYMARYVAKHIVAAGIADKCIIQLSYAIGVAEPTSINLDFQGTGKVSEDKTLPVIKELFDLTPNGIIKTLDLKKPVYRQTAAYGHFGRKGLPWEKMDQEILEKLKNSAV